MSVNLSICKDNKFYLNLDLLFIISPNKQQKLGYLDKIYSIPPLKNTTAPTDNHFRQGSRSNNRELKQFKAIELGRKT